MMFGYDVSWSEDPDFSTYGIIRAENRKGMQEALSGLVFQPGRTYTFGSSAQDFTFLWLSLFVLVVFFRKKCLMCSEVFGALPNLWMLLVGGCLPGE